MSLGEEQTKQNIFAALYWIISTFKIHASLETTNFASFYVNLP